MEIHRCRFVDWIPQSINTLSCCPDGKRIAVARKNGDIEIWNAEFKWFCQYVFLFLILFFIQLDNHWSFKVIDS